MNFHSVIVFMYLLSVMKPILIGSEIEVDWIATVWWSLWSGGANSMLCYGRHVFASIVV